MAVVGAELLYQGQRRPGRFQQQQQQRQQAAAPSEIKGSMPPNILRIHFDVAALKLERLIQEPGMAQLLQQPPPVAGLTSEQQSHIEGCLLYLTSMTLPLEATSNSAAEAAVASSASETAALAAATAAAAGAGAAAAIPPDRMLGIILRRKAARNVGTLFAWVQQRPQQLQLCTLEDMVDAGREHELPAAEALWFYSSHCLTLMGLAVAQVQEMARARCSAGTLAAAMLQQLDQSGGQQRACGDSMSGVATATLAAAGGNEYRTHTA
jgi:hypothetical protein